MEFFTKNWVSFMLMGLLRLLTNPYPHLEPLNINHLGHLWNFIPWFQYLLKWASLLLTWVGMPLCWPKFANMTLINALVCHIMCPRVGYILWSIACQLIKIFQNVLISIVPNAFRLLLWRRPLLNLVTLGPFVHPLSLASCH